MIKIPDPLRKKYDHLLLKSSVPLKEYAAYKRWLLFYLDFCKKYTHPYVEPNSLSLFCDKLKEKRQNEILVRHYSKTTLKAYSLWAEKFRYFIKDKLPENLTPDDVKESLTFLAVKKKVSASSQNQAFNALLFFFRHVLKKEFGKIEGVVRPKRKPCIPVVLSREEIDRILQNLQYPYDFVVKLLYGCGLRLLECMIEAMIFFLFYSIDARKLNREKYSQADGRKAD